MIQLRRFRTGWSFASQKQPQLVLYKDVNEIQDILVLKALHNCKLLLSETAFARCSLNSQAAWGKEALLQCGRSSCRGYNTLAKHSQAFSCPSTAVFKQKLVGSVLPKLPPAPTLSSGVFLFHSSVCCTEAFITPSASGSKANGFLQKGQVHKPPTLNGNTQKALAKPPCTHFNPTHSTAAG